MWPCGATDHLVPFQRAEIDAARPARDGKWSGGRLKVHPEINSWAGSAFEARNVVFYLTSSKSMGCWKASRSCAARAPGAQIDAVWTQIPSTDGSKASGIMVSEADISVRRSNETCSQHSQCAFSGRLLWTVPRSGLEDVPVEVR